MSPRSCRVTLRDTEGIEHTAEVTAESLYEAVVLGSERSGNAVGLKTLATTSRFES
jgi:hypothetical protein